MASPNAPVPATQAPTWRVTGQFPTTRPTAGGRLVAGVTVQFVTGSGVSGSVFVPEAMYTPERVKQLIAAKVAPIEAVSSLTSES